MTDWEDVVVPPVLFTVFCTRCYRHTARYLDGRGWDRDGKCRCDPVLPSGAELAGLIARGRRTPARHPFHGAFTHRV